MSLSSLAVKRIYSKRAFAFNGFTLPELLVATILAAAVVAVTGQVMIGQVLEGRRLEAAQRIRENYSRLNYLVQIEASESRRVVQGDGGLSGQCPGDIMITMAIPRADGDYEDQLDVSIVQYSNGALDGVSGIIRCGPGVEQNGVLIHGQPSVEGLVVSNAELLEPCRPLTPTTTGRQVSYTVEFLGGNFGAPVGECVVAHAKSVFVPNP